MWFYFLLFCVVLYLLRQWIRGAQFREQKTIENFVCVVTGANCGIGKETVRELNLRKAKVYMFCRDEKRANDSIHHLVDEGCTASLLYFIKCDMTSFASVRAAAAELKAKEEHIDILVNNAGIVFYPKFELTEDGHEVTWQTNHLGPFLLTELLLPLVERAPQGRIVNVSSLGHKFATAFDYSQLDKETSFGVIKPYNQSKLANIMHAKALTRRVREKNPETRLTINAVHPGSVNTNIAHHTFVYDTPLWYVSTPFRWFFFKSDKDGAQTVLYAALSSELVGVSGQYFSDCSRAKETDIANDASECWKLYEYSQDVTGTRISHQ